MRCEVLNLFPRGLRSVFTPQKSVAQDLNQIGIELMLRSDLAKAIAHCAAATIAVKGLRRQLS